MAWVVTGAACERPGLEWAVDTPVMEAGAVAGKAGHFLQRSVYNHLGAHILGRWTVGELQSRLLDEQGVGPR